MKRKQIEHCRKCQKAIVWMKTRNGKNMPVDAETVLDEDTEFTKERHVSHFATCPYAESFRTKKPAPPLPPFLSDTSGMPFGQYKDYAMEAVPADHLLWIWEDGLYKRPNYFCARQLVHDYIVKNWTALVTENKDVVISHPPEGMLAL